MEKGREEFEGSARLKAELTCSVCLCLYRDPVSLSCGHSFCKQCIQEVLQAPFTCPMCRLEVGPVLELQKNIQLCNIVEAFQSTIPKGKQGEGSEEEEEEEEEEVLLCDYCLDESQPAVKTCLICDASLCQAHLNKHDAKASHQDHILVEGGAGSAAEERRCLKHGRPLECYCVYDGRYICMVCAVWEHCCHGVCSLKKGHTTQLNNLSDTLMQLQERRSALVTALEELEKSEDTLKTNIKSLTYEIKKLFDKVKTQLTEKENNILSNIQCHEKKQLADITKVKKEMEQRREETEQNIQSLREMREEQDIFLFFKEFKEAKDRIASQNSGVDRVKVTVVLMDSTRTNRYQSQIDTSMMELNCILRDVQDKLAEQITWSSTKPN